VRIDGFSEVVSAIAEDGTVDYADEMIFTVSRGEPAPSPLLRAERDLPAGTDLRGSHVLLADLDPVPGGRAEIILAGQAGEVFVLDGDLDEFLDHDADPATLAPFAVGTWEDAPVPWNLPPAAGDLDGDGAPEIVLTGPAGLYAFRSDGSPLRSPLPDAHGLYAELGLCRVPPVLLADDDGTVGAAVVVEGGLASWLRVYEGSAADLALEINLGRVVVRAPPVLAWDRLWLAAADTVSGSHRLLGCALDGAASDPIIMHVLEGEPGRLPPAWGYEAGDPAEAGRWITVFSVDGTGETVRLDTSLERRGANRVWPETVAARSGLAAGSLMGDGWFGGFEPLGDWADGWPQRPLPEFTAPDTVVGAGPLAAALAGNVRARQQRIFTAPDGRIFAYGPQGEGEAGWPLPGPASAAGTPALGNVAGALQDDLVAIGTFARIGSVDADTGQAQTQWRSVVTLWEDVAVPGGLWTMWGGSPRRDGAWDAASGSPPVSGASGSGIMSGSLICYPNPLAEGPLHVRARLRSAGRVRAHVYNLEGERVASSAWRDVAAQSAFDIAVDLPRAVSGMYLCRLEAVTAGGAGDTGVVPFAVSR
jgi:hypothetical protein